MKLLAVILVLVAMTTFTAGAADAYIAHAWGVRISSLPPEHGDIEAVRACTSVDLWEYSPEVWRFIRTLSHGDETVIGLHVVVGFRVEKSMDLASVERICTYHMNKHTDDLDLIMQRRQKNYPEKVWITWELDLPDRIVVKRPGRRAETTMRVTGQ